MVRFKNRYLLAELVFEDGKIDEKITVTILQKLIREAITRHFGDFGHAAVINSLQGPHQPPLLLNALNILIRSKVL